MVKKMAKKQSKGPVEIIKELLKSKNLVFGTEKTLKAIKQQSMEKVLVAENCPEATKESLHSYQTVYQFKLVPVAVSNKDLGVMCKKHFPVSVIGLLKGE
jgi:ribosomal protein L30E